MSERGWCSPAQVEWYAILCLAIALAVVFAPATDGYGGADLPGFSDAMGARILAPASPDALVRADRPTYQSLARRAALPEPAGPQGLPAFVLMAVTVLYPMHPKPQATVAASGSRGPPIRA